MALKTGCIRFIFKCKILMVIGVLHELNRLQSYLRVLNLKTLILLAENIVTGLMAIYLLSRREL